MHACRSLGLHVFLCLCVYLLTPAWTGFQAYQVFSPGSRLPSAKAHDEIGDEGVLLMQSLAYEKICDTQGEIPSWGLAQEHKRSPARIPSSNVWQFRNRNLRKGPELLNENTTSPYVSIGNYGNSATFLIIYVHSSQVRLTTNDLNTRAAGRGPPAENYMIQGP